jgi:carboxypeptidase C (cathepsin A)
MKKLLLSLIVAVSFNAVSQKSAPIISVEPEPQGVAIVKTTHAIIIGGKTIQYTAFTGYMHMKQDTGKVLSKIFFTYYQKEGEDAGKRPVTFTFNGGPGSASLWLHMGGVGPKRVLLKDDGSATAAPYTYIPNEFSWLDKTDLV